MTAPPPYTVESASALAPPSWQPAPEQSHYHGIHRDANFKDFEEGLAELAEWVASQEAVDRVDQAKQELEARGLVA